MTHTDTLPRWNARYLAFCTARGMHPDSDAAQGTPNHQYIDWIMGQWGDWRTENKRSDTLTTDADHAAFDVWLWTRVRAQRGLA